MAEPFIGEIKIFAGNFAPRGWAMCDGNLLPIAQNTALFSILGTTYGGNGRTDFALPNLKGRIPVHSGGGSAGPGLPAMPLGSRGGSATVQLTSQQLPSHSHPLQCASASAHTGAPSGALPAPIEGAPAIYSQSTSNLVAFDSRTVTSSGGGQAHENRQPALGVYFIIAIQGLFPSRA